MFKPILVALYLCTFSSICFCQIPKDYYNSAQNLTGSELREALHTIIKDHKEYPYTSTSTDVWNILCESDKDPQYPDNVILVYTGESVNGAQEYNSRQGWSREHVWAKSHGDFGTSKGAGTDLHHLKPADISVNSARNNKDFDYGGDRYYDNGGTVSTDCFSDTYTWEPRSEVKGDIARMIFYMAVRYNGEEGEPSLLIEDDINTIDLCIDDTKVGYIGKLSTLLEWHASDPVDSFEINRNNVIHTYQENRNPFIDYPDYITQIWSNTSQLNSSIPTINYNIRTVGNGFTLVMNNDAISTFNLYTISGRTIYSTQFSQSYEDNTLVSGVYIFTIDQADYSVRGKLLIK